MRKIILLAVLGLSLGLIWIGYSTSYVMSAQDTLGKEVDDIQISIRLNKTRFTKKEPIVLDLQITNVMRVGSGKKAYDTYIPWVLSRPSTFYEVHAVDENGKDRIICGGEGKDCSLEVLHLPPGHFCGYRLTCGSKGVGDRPDLRPGKYRLYAVFKNSYAKLPGPGISIDIRRLTTQERRELSEALTREIKRIERENNKLGQSSLWVGKVFSDSETIEIVQQ